MTEHSKPTPGPARVEQDTTLVWGACDPDDRTTYGMGYPIAEAKIMLGHGSPFCREARRDEAEANANLIAEAFTTLHETGLTPRELQKQRDELHSELDAVAAAMPVRFMDVPDGGSPTLGEQVARMRQALVAAEKQRDELLAALREVVAVSKSGADTVSFLVDLNAIARKCAAAIAKVSA